MSGKSPIVDSISHLRVLRDKLCSEQKDWQEAYRIRDFVIKKLEEIYTGSPECGCACRKEVGALLENFIELPSCNSKKEE